MNIRVAQNNLVDLGYGILLGGYGVDGKLGTKTRGATRVFQRDYNRLFKKKITVDGVPGPQTKKAFDHWKRSAGKVGTRNFKMSEFRCKGSGKLPANGMDNSLILKLERLRYNLGNKPITINSGYRTAAHNKRVGGASRSQHLYGKAADIVVKGVSPSRVYAAADKLFNGVGKYNTFTHVDTRSYKARF